MLIESQIMTIVYLAEISNKKNTKGTCCKHLKYFHCRMFVTSDELVDLKIFSQRCVGELAGCSRPLCRIYITTIIRTSQLLTWDLLWLVAGCIALIGSSYKSIVLALSNHNRSVACWTKATARNRKMPALVFMCAMLGIWWTGCFQARP